jgi:prenyltransferase beta subunit
MSIKRTIGTALIALTVVMALALAALADSPQALEWLKAQQNADGGFGSPASSAGATADVLLAAAATGDNALGWAQEGGETAQAFLVASASSVVKAGEAAKVALALIASGVNPRDVGGVDLVAKLEEMVGDDGRIGGEGEFLNEHAYSMIALCSARRGGQRPVPAEAVQYLLDRQIEDGTWSWNGDTTAGSGDNNTAAMAVVALIAAGIPADDARIQKTLDHFQGQQNADGGFPYISPSDYGTDSDSNSTSVVMWAILAAGQDPAGVDWKFQGQDGLSALDRLRAFQNASGAFRWQDGTPDDNLASTVQAVIAMELKTLPFATMDVDGGIADADERAADADEPVGDESASDKATPELLPETGVNLWLQSLALLGAGIALVGVGLWLRRRVLAKRPVRHDR